MDWKVLKTEEDYTKAGNRLMEIFHAETHSSEFEEMELLLVLVKDYDDKYYPIPKLSTLDIMKFKALEIWKKLFMWISK